VLITLCGGENLGVYVAAAALRKLVKRTIEEIRSICDGHSVVYVMFSGGRDSLVALDLTLRALGRGKTEALFIDTGIATPGLLKNYIAVVAESYGVKLNVISPKYDFFELVLKKGFPMVKYRWCKDYLKIKPLREFVKAAKESRGDVILITGLRAGESWMKSKASKLYDHPKLSVRVYAPIHGWREKQVKEYIRFYGLMENPLYLIYGKAYDCWCTVFKTPADFALLAINHPDFFMRFVETEAKLKSKGSALYLNGRRVYLEDISKRPWEYLRVGCRARCPCYRLTM